LLIENEHNARAARPADPVRSVMAMATGIFFEFGPKRVSLLDFIRNP
jgi:hypothetical protein